MNKIIPLLLFLIVLSSCESNKIGDVKESEEVLGISEQLIGKWHNLAIKVVIQAEHGDSIALVPYEKWEEILKIKPIVTSFNDDSTFVSEYISLDGEVMMTATGTWFVKGDSLVMTERGRDNVYFTTLKYDTISFTGFIDWDEDGEADDLYTGTQIRH